MAKLIGQRYGKAQVRVLKILRDGPIHTIREIEVSALLAGDFETSYTAGDNTKVVPTDTIKNTVNVFAKQHLVDDLERFAVILGEHFVRRHEQVAQATIEITERGWDRLESGGKPHPHAFEAASNARRYARAICTADASEVTAGIRDLVILKSTGFGLRRISEMRIHDPVGNGGSNPRDFVSCDMAFYERPGELLQIERRDSGRDAEASSPRITVPQRKRLCFKWERRRCKPARKFRASISPCRTNTASSLTSPHSVWRMRTKSSSRRKNHLA